MSENEVVARLYQHVADIVEVNGVQLEVHWRSNRIIAYDQYAAVQQIEQIIGILKPDGSMHMVIECMECTMKNLDALLRDKTNNTMIFIPVSSRSDQ